MLTSAQPRRFIVLLIEAILIGPPNRDPPATPRGATAIFQCGLSIGSALNTPPRIAKSQRDRRMAGQLRPARSPGALPTKSSKETGHGTAHGMRAMARSMPHPRPVASGTTTAASVDGT